MVSRYFLFIMMQISPVQPATRLVLVHIQCLSVLVTSTIMDNQSVVLANPGNDQIELLLRYNNNIFLDRMILSTDDGSHPQSVTIADFNQDHLLDIAFVNAWHNEMNVYLRLGDGSFGRRRVYSTGAASIQTQLLLVT